MKAIAISSLECAWEALSASHQHGYDVAFVYHHADPEHKLVDNKFLYVNDDKELLEKLHLLKSDRSIRL